ncbi:MAG: protein kinase, partial [Planctomycetes bacterium]|nr:protein kinase [Planctomycetota bacterium]
MDPDLRFGHIAVRMGAIRPQDLPQLMREARVGIPDERGKPITGLGQVLLKRGLISVDDYLYMARQVSEEQEAHMARQALEQVNTAWTAYESGELDREQFEEILGRSGEPILRPTEPVRSFGPYTLEGEVARGGMGIVYRARDPSDRVVALKVMINADDDEVRLRRFEREAELAAALEHPNVVSIHDAGRIDGIPYFTMDLIDGESLEDQMERGLEVDQVIELLVQVAHGLSHAHERGVVHRDLKPGNILVDSQGGAHITDFGLARDLARLTRLTAVGQAVGTPYYMAPEQVRGERDVDGRADVYAAGVILYEALTGDVPFDADTPLTLFRKIDAEPVVLELDEALGIDPWIREITLRALAKERDDRYPDALRFAEDLERYQQGLPPRPLGQDLKTRLLTHRLLLPTLGLALLALLSAGFAGSLLLERHRDQAILERGRGLAREALASSTQAAERAEGELAAGHAETACEVISQALAVARRAQDPELRGAADAFRDGGGPKLLERLHRIHLQAWVARTAQDPRGYEQALGALDAANAAGVEATPEFALSAGLLLTGAGRAVEALPLLDRAVVALDERRDALVARARARLDLGQPLGAAADLSAVLGGGEATSDVLVLRARAYLAQRRLSAAEADAQRAHDLALRDPEPLLLLGDVAREQGEVETARADDRAAAGRDARDARCELRLAELAWQTGEPTRALKHLDLAAGLEGPGDPALRLRVHLAELDLQAARGVAAEAPRPAPTPRERQRVLGAWHTARAELALAQGQPEEAWAALDQAL